jgi:hypothetical protein
LSTTIRPLGLTEIGFEFRTIRKGVEGSDHAGAVDTEVEGK